MSVVVSLVIKDLKFSVSVGEEEDGDLIYYPY